MNRLVTGRFMNWFDENEETVDLYVVAKIKSSFYHSGVGVVVLFKDGMSEVIDSSLLERIVEGDESLIHTYDFSAIG